MAKGYSARYLHQWGYGVLIRDAGPDFMARYDRCWLTAQGKHTTEWSEDALLLTYDAITNWVEQRTGQEVTIGTFSE